MHLVTKAFNSVITKNKSLFEYEQIKWYEQILRLIALTHDLGHAPFSHGSESLFPAGMKHEDFTDKIIMETEIAEYIERIGHKFANEYGKEFIITPELICSIYRGRDISNPDFVFLRKFVDSELDCDKMDYLLRDSLYCGVNYGKYDLERLVESLTAYKENDNIFLAVDEGGLHAFEEFVLARYFMFIQVYFHKTRRFLDKMLIEYLESILPNRTYPNSVEDYLEWDDVRVWEMIKEDEKRNCFAERIMNRRIMKMIYETPVYLDKGEKKIYNLIKKDVRDKFGEENIFIDSADKITYKIPTKYEIEEEIPEEAKRFVEQRIKDMSDSN